MTRAEIAGVDPKHPDRQERHSGTGRRGDAPKGGAGKFNEGRIDDPKMYEDLPISKNDPSYQPDVDGE